MEEVGVLRASRVVAAGWAVAGIGAVALAAWILLDSGGHPLAWGLMIACVVVTVPQLVQLLVPAAYTVEIASEGLRLRFPLRRVTVAWSRIRLARVSRHAGDPALELHVDDQRPRTYPLPAGVDLRALHAGLAAHLGPPGGDRSPAADGSAVGDGASAAGGRAPEPDASQ